MMLRHTYKLEMEARSVESAIRRTLEAGYGTRDLGGVAHPVSTEEFGALIRRQIEAASTAS
jgi:isocitrate/isopropylmalate dehydrogenase